MKPAFHMPSRSWTCTDWDQLWERRCRDFVLFQAAGTFESPLKVHLNLSVPKNAKRIIEVGSGSGRLAVQLAVDHPESIVIGLDKSAWAIRLSERMALAKGCTNVLFIQGDMRQLPFPSGTFDFVISEGLIEHFDDYRQLVSEHSRVCANGGCVVEIVPNAYCVPHRFLMLWQGNRYYYGFMRLFSRGKLASIMMQCGLLPTYEFGVDPFYLSGARWYKIAPIVKSADYILRPLLDGLSRGAFSRALGFEIGIAGILHNKTLSVGRAKCLAPLKRNVKCTRR